MPSPILILNQTDETSDPTSYLIETILIMEMFIIFLIGLGAILGIYWTYMHFVSIFLEDDDDSSIDE